jgi:phospho-N-acetylmuramoyl-pentapeptide-transferase
MAVEMTIVAKILILSSASFIFAMFVTPILTHFLFKYNVGKNVRDDTEKTPIVAKLHQHKGGIPTMGGILVWGTTLLFALFFLYVPMLLPDVFPESLNFLTRAETLLPLGALIASAIVGLVDDVFNLKKMGASGGGLHLRHRLIIFTIIAVVAAWWFYFKLDWTVVYIPFIGNLEIGWMTIPLFIIVIVATSFSVNETDGLDGLAGGVLMTSFATYAAIAFIQGSYDLATFCAVISGSLLAFLWFNVHPARFFMGDTGSMSLGVTLGVVAMLTNTVWLLPLIGFILVMESASVIIQVTSKKIRKKKVFLAAPIHHHFEAMGWEEPKIVMRAWIISGVVAVVGLVLFLIERSLWN